MFGWRKRSEGFEWREYVRTTVLVRRADRQKRLDEARLDALAKISDVRDRGIAASKNGADAAWGRTREFLQSWVDIAFAVLTATARSTWGILKSSAAYMRAATSRLPMPSIRIDRLRASAGSPAKTRPDTDTAGRVPSFLYTAYALITLIPIRYVAGATAVVASALIFGPLLTGTQDSSVAALVPKISVSAEPSVVAGRATAVTGGILRVNGELVELKGVEPPSPKHPCIKANGRRWSCAASATSALNRLIRAEDVTCEIEGRNGDGRAIGTCAVAYSGKATDIGAELVRNGHVFAAAGMFAAYASDEATARDGKLGLWQGETVRPQEWRDRTWEEAKRTAPDGCPIKGLVRASERVYAMPWSPEYASAKVREVRGERWFCSEDDARAAGFRLSHRL
jgi:endonuclease YncB( thermonuclease family)